MSSDKTSVAVSRPLSERIKEFASSKGTTTSGVCEVILTAALSGEIPGAYDLGYPMPGKRGRKGAAPEAQADGDPGEPVTEPEAADDDEPEGDPLDVAEAMAPDDVPEPEGADDFGDFEGLPDAPEDLGFESDGT